MILDDTSNKSMSEKEMKSMLAYLDDRLRSIEGRTIADALHRGEVVEHMRYDETKIYWPKRCNISGKWHWPFSTMLKGKKSYPDIPNETELVPDDERVWISKDELIVQRLKGRM